MAGYPRLFSDSVDPSSGCIVGLGLGAFSEPIDLSDVEWLNSVALTLNSTIGGEVRVAQIALRTIRPDVKLVFAGVGTAFAHRRLCEPSYPDASGSWLHGLELSGTSVLQVSFHPNQRGQQAYATAVKSQS